MTLSARTCRLCGKPKGAFAFHNIDEIAAEAGIPVIGTPRYAHPKCFFDAKRKRAELREKEKQAS